MTRLVSNDLADRLVRDTLMVFDGQPIDVVLVSLAEALARVLAETSGSSDAYLQTFDRCARRWLASGVLGPGRLH